jgi:hypothetical protein
MVFVVCDVCLSITVMTSRTRQTAETCLVLDSSFETIERAVYAENAWIMLLQGVLFSTTLPVDPFRCDVCVCATATTTVVSSRTKDKR